MRKRLSHSTIVAKKREFRTRYITKTKGASKSWTCRFKKRYTTHFQRHKQEKSRTMYVQEREMNVISKARGQNHLGVVSKNIPFSQAAAFLNLANVTLYPSQSSIYTPTPAKQCQNVLPEPQHSNALLTLDGLLEQLAYRFRVRAGGGRFGVGRGWGREGGGGGGGVGTGGRGRHVLNHRSPKRNDISWSECRTTPCMTRAHSILDPIAVTAVVLPDRLSSSSLSSSSHSSQQPPANEPLLPISTSRA
ncbi:hypothetical protein BKA70DRAFT_681697 [Coprinopsis sp. MPI-PUGE-AT-0042]|nr:hypothetical protein BKA70DRAFT_681697 [Coprinopsis sp. MPI-PUGE-AT-0042]